MASRIASTDVGFVVGQLSNFPEAMDDKDTLYVATNNAETTLKQSLTYNGKLIILEDASSFPPYGLVRLSHKYQPGELVYYGRRTDTTLSDLIRGFAGSLQNNWPSGETYVQSSVMAEHHNAIKDAVINIETYVGVETNPDSTSLNGRMKLLETKYLAPKPLFRAFPIKGPPPLNVRFQNFSEGDAIRFLWDFGDGTTSTDRNPNHNYQQEGIYSVKLNIITSSGAQGVVIKDSYITVAEEEKVPFFYVVPTDEEKPNYSEETANSVSSTAQVFSFVDQSDGQIAQRYWVFGDGTNNAITDPDIHSITHTYEKPGTYDPSLIIVFSTKKLKRVFLTKKLEVI